MIDATQQETVQAWLDAHKKGISQAMFCSKAGIATRTLQRWIADSGLEPTKDDKNAKIKELLLEQVIEQKGLDAKIINRRAAVSAARDMNFLDDLKNVLEKTFSKKLGLSGYAKKAPNNKRKSRIVNVALSDLHFHSLLDPREVPLRYGPTEEARRFGKIVQETCDFKSQYRNDSELFVHIFGDIIQGALHDPRDAATITMQFGAATYYITQALIAFSKAFPKVTVRCVPGNHGRNKQRHPDRAVSQKFDSFENMIYLAVKYAVATLPNVEVIIPYTPYYSFKAFDKTGFVTHGDTVLDVGFPSNAINITKIRNQVNEWNAGKMNYDMFLVGHVHCGSMVHLPSGPVFMSNSCLLPPDPYAISSGRPNSNSGQWLFESTQGHIVGDARFLTVDVNTDKQAQYEKIIKPFSGFETDSPLK